MIAEPYICVKGKRAGLIEWYGVDHEGKLWHENERQNYDDSVRPYAEFEREKLAAMGGDFVFVEKRDVGLETMAAYVINIPSRGKTWSSHLTDYLLVNFIYDSEYNRLLKRAEFLKAVCEKEGVQFLPAQADLEGMKKCCFEGCENEGANGRGNHCWKHYHRIRKYGDPDMVGHQWRIESLADHAGIKRIIEEKVVVNDETGCWEWGGTRSKQGYGKQTIKREKQQTFAAHRLAAMVYLGFDIDSEELVCHKCDNPPCCNPDHLFIGDWKANSDDMVAKGRAVDVSDRKRTEGGTFLPKAA